MTDRTRDEGQGRAASGGMLDALFGDLDDDTRRRYGLSRPDGAPLPEMADDIPAVAGEPSVTKSDLRFSDLVSIGKRTVKQIGEDRVPAVAGGVTFFGLLSLFPAITAFVSLYGLVADPATIAQHMKLLERFMPAAALDVIRDQIEAIASAPGTALSVAGLVGLATAFYSANGGMKALLTALNVAFFQKETRGFFKLNLVAMGFTLGGLVILGLMLGVIAVLPAALKWLPMVPATEEMIALLRWPVMFVVLMLVLATVYRWGPARQDTRWRVISPGAVFAAVALVAVSAGFSWYAANFGNYNQTYGSLGAAVLLMMWLWLSAMVVLIGAELNSEVERQLRLREGRPVPDL